MYRYPGTGALERGEVYTQWVCIGVFWVIYPRFVCLL